MSSMVSSMAALALPPPPGPGAASLIGERVGRYVITRELARGGMGVVYEAVHESIGVSLVVCLDSGAGNYDQLTLPSLGFRTSR